MEKVKTTLYRCAACGLPEAKAGSIPKDMEKHNRHYARDPRYRHLCPECGAIMYPDSLYGMHGTDEGRFLDLFSICPNASECAGYDLYAPDCENQHLKPRCLNMLLNRIDVLDDRLERVEKLLIPPDTSATPASPQDRPEEEPNT